jgi:hypothetical protein
MDVEMATPAFSCAASIAKQPEKIIMSTICRPESTR